MSESIASVISSPADTARMRLLATQGDVTDQEGILEQFEALFLQQMLKSMRASSLGEGLLQSDQSEFFRDMYDQQLAADIAQNRLLGISDLISRDLGLAQQSTSDSEDVENTGFDITSIERIDNASNTHVQSVLETQIQPNFELIKEVENPSANLREQFTLNDAEVSRNQQAFIPDSPQDFVAHASQFAQQAAERLGVSADVLVAIAALETGWGQHLPTDGNAISNNYFGIKADIRWQGESVNSQTLEFANGVFNKQTESFRSYENLQDSFNDFAEFILGNERYAKALHFADDASQFLNEIQKAGYATDPEYANKILNVLDNKAFLSN